MVLEELFVNVCRYAYADQDTPGKVQITYAYGANPSSITVELRDQGAPFDPTLDRGSAKVTSDGNLRIGGLGILMVREAVDDFAYLRDGDTNVTAFKIRW